MGGTFIVIQQYPVVLLYHQIVSYGVFLGENLCDCRTAFVRFFLQQAVALQWLREPCLLLGNKKNECGLFHNQIDFFFFKAEISSSL